MDMIEIYKIHKSSLRTMFDNKIDYLNVALDFPENCL